jgi:phosphatidylglycerol---prolipoprotein diacylglyceryl transferase
VGGKTIVGALAFGLLSVELMKRYIGLRASTGDLYAIPLALGIAIGRVGCFLTGLADNTYGTPTLLPWAVDFGDSIPRHPTQLYEIAFLLLLIPMLWAVLARTGMGSKATGSRGLGTQPGDAFKLLMVAYMTFRLLADFIKPYPRLFLGLGAIQWTCVLILLYYSRDILRWVRGDGGRKQIPASSTRLC